MTVATSGRKSRLCLRLHPKGVTCTNGLPTNACRTHPCLAEVITTRKAVFTVKSLKEIPLM